MWRNEHTTETDAPPEAVWDIWTDVSDGWPRFLTMDWARLEGDFAIGTEGRIKHHRGPQTNFKIVALEPGHFYATEAKMPGAHLRFEHTVENTASGGTRMTERQAIDGALTRLYGLVFGRQMIRELPDSLAKLGELASERKQERTVPGRA